MYPTEHEFAPGASLPAATPILLDELFQQSHSFLAVVSGPDRVFEYVNAAYLERVGRADITGRTVRDALPELVGQGVLEELEQVFRTGEPLVVSERAVMIRRAAGGELERRIGSYVYQPLRDENGAVARVAVHGLDVTDHVVAREALHARETFYRSLLENSQDKITAFRTDGTVVYESPAIERLLGWLPSEVIGTNVLDLVHPDDLAAARGAAEALTRGSSGSALELRLKHRDGSWRMFEVIGKLHSTAEGPQIITNCRDITERRAADRALRERDALFRTLVELIPQLVWSTTPDGYHDYFNQKWYEYTGMPLTGDQGWNWSDYLHPDDRERTFEVWNLSLTTGQPYEVEYRFRRRDGEYRWFIGRAQPLRDETGRIVRWFGTCTDVHDERTARDAARESQERFECAARATNNVIWDWNLETGELWHNENLRQAFAIPDAALMGASSWERRIHPEDRKRVWDKLHAAIADGDELWTDEYRFMRGDGSWAHVLDRGLLIRDAEQRPVRMIGSMADMTRRMQLEEELRQAQKLEAIGRLAGGVAHDFNNLLTVITSYTEILLEDLQKEDHASRTDVDEIRRAANSAASLTRQLLAFSRRQVLQPRDIDLNDIMADVEKMLRRIIGETIRLATVPGHPLNVIRADPGQIEQIIMNLVVNSRDAMPSGGTITLRTENRYLGSAEADRRGVPQGDYVAFTVEDDGLGMEPAVLARAFEPFFTTKAAGHGTGLGLATVHGIVRQSGGSVSIESEPGRGTRVQIMLPAVGSAPVRSSSVAAPPPAEEKPSGTILLVEDEEAVRRITVRSLKRFGYDVLEADNGAEALRLLDDNGAVDLVLTDLVMPQMSGRELAAQLRQRAAAPPVLFMSGYSEEDVIGGGDENSALSILEKPFTVQQLSTAVARAISRTNGQRL